MKLLTRDEFREAVFARDKGLCVVCKNKGVDAHHILERRLWADGGYYLDNGATLCSDCHIECEKTAISVNVLRELINGKVVLPEHFYPDQEYDKWGNIILPSGWRLKGELFYDESVQKILTGRLNLFREEVKYPRTYHLPWSENITDDDRVLKSLDIFNNNDVVITEKMDGENTTMYNHTLHARSTDSPNHPSRNWVKNFWSKIAYQIPIGWRICGENMYAKHSIQYENLPSYFIGFSIWDNRNLCLDWYTTLEWFNLLEITPPGVLYDGKFNESKIKKLHDILNPETYEGYVIRIKSGFSYGNFRNCVAKFVRKNHVKTTKHWMHGQQIERNGLAK